MNAKGRKNPCKTLHETGVESGMSGASKREMNAALRKVCLVVAGPYREVWDALSRGNCGVYMPRPIRMAVAAIAGTLSYVLVFAMLRGAVSCL